MARAIIAVIVSYIVMFVISFCAFTGVYMMLHAEGSFKPSSFEASSLWIAIALSINFVVAVIGGPKLDAFWCGVVLVTSWKLAER